MSLKCFNCGARSGGLYKLPSMPELKNMWLDVIPDVRGTNLKRHFRICTLHFDEKFITKTGRVRRNAIPSKFLMDDMKWYDINRKVILENPTKLTSVKPPILHDQSEIAFEYVEIKQEHQTSEPLTCISPINPVPFIDIKSEPEDDSPPPSPPRGLKRKLDASTNLLIAGKSSIKGQNKPEMIDQRGQTEEFYIKDATQDEKDEIIARLKRENLQLRENLATKTHSLLGIISIESLKCQNNTVRYLTGFPIFATMEIIYKDVENSMPTTTFGKISKFDIFFMTCMKLKLDLSVNYFSVLMNIRTMNTLRLFYDTFKIVYGQLSEYIVWPDNTSGRLNTPTDYEYKQLFGDRRFIIVDSFEIFGNINSTVQQRSNHVNQLKSQLQPVKYLICFSTSGTIIYLSKPFETGVHKHSMVQQSDFLNMIEAEDVILADREFILSKSFLHKVKCKSKEIVPMVKNAEGELARMTFNITDEFIKVREEIVKWILFMKHRIMMHTKRPCLSAITNKYGEKLYSDFVTKMACAIVNLTPSQADDLVAEEIEELDDDKY